tara:strand:+ start:907 stop:1704 length:798 start_codon:yes stop_codon:yes gene_type:complete
MTKNLKIFCVTDKLIKKIEKTNLILASVGKNNLPNNYIKSSSGKNIHFKEQYYSELTFHYWYWKNMLNKETSDWIGFCQKRRFWVKTQDNQHKIDNKNYFEYLLSSPEKSWNNYSSIICNPIKISGSKKIKIIKKGWKNLIKDPTILFNTKKETIKFHFDIYHGNGKLTAAINLLHEEDRSDFNNYVNSRDFFNPHIMFITRPEVAKKWFKDLFGWLEKCENLFGFNELKGYETRLYGYLAERYLSFWFKKYTKYKEHPWIFIDN